MSSERALLPFFAILLAIALFSVMDATMKHASIAVGAYSATLWRTMIGFALVLPLWLHEGAKWPSRPALIVHLKRGVVGAGTTVTFFFGLVRLPLVEAISISFIAPLITLFLAAILLGEKIGTRAIGASLLGLGGVVVIAFAGSRPETSHPEAGLGIAAVLLSAVLYAWNLVLQRQQALLARPREVGVFQTAVATVTLGLASPWLLVVPQGDDWAYVGTSAVLALAALMLASWAYGRAEAQALVPFEYSAFLWAALIGWVAFSEAVTLPTIIGAVLIIAGCWIATPKRHIEQTAL